MTPARSPVPCTGQERAHPSDDPSHGLSLPELLRARAVNVVESTIPADMTIAEWRASRRRPTTPAPCLPSRALAAVRRLMHAREVQCDHLNDTTTRYDHAAKRLDFFLACPVCRTERLVHSLPYEPRFVPTGATVHPLRPRRPNRQVPKAA